MAHPVVWPLYTATVDDDDRFIFTVKKNNFIKSKSSTFLWRYDRKRHV